MAQERKTARYRTLGTIRSGNLFTLTKAVDEQDQLPVLVRRFASHLFEDDAGWLQFRQSLQEFSQIAVSGLLPVRQIGGSTRQPWIVVGPTDGTTLRERLSAKLPASPLESLEPVANALTELHALGHVHGRVQSDSIFFDQNNRPCLDETASVHALCGWDASQHELHPGLIGELVAAEYLAPEIREGGLVTPQTDQYSLAVVLMECLTGQPPNSTNLTAAPKARQGIIEPLLPVLARAQAEDPQQRYPTCREFFVAARLAQQGQKRRQLQRFAVVAGLLVLLAAAFVGKWELDRRGTIQEESRLVEAKERRRREIASDYEIKVADMKAVHDLSVPKNLVTLRSEPESKEFVEGILKKYNFSGESPFSPRPQNSSGQLSKGPAPTVTLTFPSASTPRTGNQGNIASSSSFFLVTDTGYAVRLDEPKQINWSVDVKWFTSVRKEFNLSAEIIDGADKVLARQSVKVPSSMFKTVVSSTFAPVNLKVGDSFRARVLLQEEGQSETEWAKSAIWYRVGVLESQSKALLVSPSSVQASGYEMDSGLELRPGDNVRIQASGSITLGDDNMHKTFQCDKALRFSPAGLPWTSGALSVSSNARLLPVSENRAHSMGSLLFRLGSGPWDMVANRSANFQVRNTPTEFEAKRSIQQNHEIGKLSLSLNSIRSKDKKDILRSVKTYWVGDDGFDVRITVQSAKFPAETSEATKIKARSSLGS